MARSLLQSLAVFLHARLTPETHLGLHLTIGALVMVGAGFLFGMLAVDVIKAGEITVVDVQVANWFHAHATPPVTQFMLLVTDVHGTFGILALCLLFAFHLIRAKALQWLLTVVVAVPVGMLLNVVLKHAFQRARPSFDDPLLTLTTFSFPSGHAAGATLFYGVLAAYLICKVKPWRWRIFIALLAVVMIAAVGLSRIYLGVHYLSDVLAAVAASGVWLAFSLTAITTWRRRRMIQNTGETF